MKRESKVGKIKHQVSPTPSQCEFFIADDIRVERGDKPTLIGFYPDKVIVVQVPPSEPAPTKENPRGIPSIAVMARFAGAIGEYNAEVELNGVGGVPLVRSDQQKLISKKQNLHFIARFMPLPIVGFGMYEIVVKLDGRSYKEQFEVRRGDLDLADAGSIRFGSRLEAKAKQSPQTKRKRPRKK